MRDWAAGARYEIRVRGVLGETLLAAFPSLDARADGRDTILTGWLPDQSALHGVLAQIESLNLDLIEVRRRHAAGSRSRPAPRAIRPDRTTTAHPLGREGERERRGAR